MTAGAVVSIGDLQSWSAACDTSAASGDAVSYNNEAKFPVDAHINDKICLWRGQVADLKADAIVNPTNESLNDWTGVSAQILKSAGPALERTCMESDGCRTGESMATASFGSAAKMIIHSVGPRYSSKYHVAAETSLHSCYHTILLRALEYKLETVACPPVFEERKGFPRQAAAHIACRTVRRFLERKGNAITRFAFVVDSDTDEDLFEKLLPLYFPRNQHEERVAEAELPADVGDEWGSPCDPDRSIRVAAFPGASNEDDHESGITADKLESKSSGSKYSLGLASSSSVFDNPFTVMRDERKAGMSSDDPGVANAMLEARYEGNLQLAYRTDHSVLEKAQFLYSAGKDVDGRRMFVVNGSMFPARTADPKKLLLFIMNTMDEAVNTDFVVIFINTNLGLSNIPSISAIKTVYSNLTRKYKKNLKKLFVVHPAWTFKVAKKAIEAVASPKFLKKIVLIERLSQLDEAISPATVPLPDFVKRYDSSLPPLP